MALSSQYQGDPHTLSCAPVIGTKKRRAVRGAGQRTASLTGKDISEVFCLGKGKAPHGLSRETHAVLPHAIEARLNMRTGQAVFRQIGQGVDARRQMIEDIGIGDGDRAR